MCRVAKMKAERTTTKEKVEKLTENPVNCVQEGCQAKPGELSIVISRPKGSKNGRRA